MDGIFKKQRFGNKYTIIGLFSGIFLLFRFGSLLINNAELNWDNIIFASFFTFFGLFMIVACSISLYVNKKAFIHVSEQKISAFCHYGLSLECNLVDVKDLSYSSVSLTIHLQNGKNYNIFNLENGYELGNYIQKRMTAEPYIVVNPDEVKASILPLKAKCKREGFWAISCIFLMVPEIILTSALTGWKELHEFSQQDWTIFSVMFAFGVLTIVLTCVLLRKYLFDNDRREKTQGALRQTLLRTAPLQPGNAIKAYIDDMFHASYRLIIYGFPNSEKVYFILEDVNQEFDMQCVYTSEIYANMDALDEELEEMIEIPIPGKL